MPNQIFRMTMSGVVYERRFIWRHEGQFSELMFFVAAMQTSKRCKAAR
jgi:hypothetical protein